MLFLSPIVCIGTDVVIECPSNAMQLEARRELKMCSIDASGEESSGNRNKVSLGLN
jgi:hypothetical protein